MPPGDIAAGHRAGTLVVHYGGPALARAIALAGPGADILAAGAGADPGLPWAPEAALPARYATAERVLVIDDDPSPLARARALLPAACGAATELLRADGSTSPVAFTDADDARGQAAMLVGQVRQQLADQLPRGRP